MMHKSFNKQIRVNMEIYIDNIVVKSKQGSSLLTDLQQSFGKLRNFSMKLNLDKCVFWVTAGQLLGFIVSLQGIEASLEKKSKP